MGSGFCSTLTSGARASVTPGSGAPQAGSGVGVCPRGYACVFVSGVCAGVCPMGVRHNAVEALVRGARAMSWRVRVLCAVTKTTDWRRGRALRQGESTTGNDSCAAKAGRQQPKQGKARARRVKVGPSGLSTEYRGGEQWRGQGSTSRLAGYGRAHAGHLAVGARGGDGGTGACLVWWGQEKGDGWAVVSGKADDDRKSSRPGLSAGQRRNAHVQALASQVATRRRRVYARAEASGNPRSTAAVRAWRGRIRIGRRRPFE